VCLCTQFIFHMTLHSVVRRENTVLRGQLFEPAVSHTPSAALSVNPNVYVIPNALVPDQFKPLDTPMSSDTSTHCGKLPIFVAANLFFRVVTIVVISRLAYRKGIDLLVATAPRICAAFPQVKFLVGLLCFPPSCFLTYKPWFCRG
jgi:phosphatidylinositol glycan class A protein